MRFHCNIILILVWITGSTYRKGEIFEEKLECQHSKDFFFPRSFTVTQSSNGPKNVRLLAKYISKSVLNFHDSEHYKA